MNEWNEMNNRDENGSGLSAYTQGRLSPAMYNVSIGVHLLVGLVITYFLALRMPYVLPQIYSVHPLIFSVGFLVVGVVGGMIAAKLCSILDWIRSEYLGFRNPTVLCGAHLSGTVYCFGCSFNYRGGYNDDRCGHALPECLSLHGKDAFYCFDRSGGC